MQSQLRTPVIQEDNLGCAIASTAFILNISYQQAILMFKNGKIRARKVPNFYCPEIVTILRRNGLNYSWAKLSDNNMDLLQTDLVIVFCEQSSNLPFGHFLAKNKNKWMNPWLNLPKLPRTAGFTTQLPGKPTYIIYPNK